MVTARDNPNVYFKCHETTNVPMVKYNFVQLSGLESLAKDAVCGMCCCHAFRESFLQTIADVIGVVKDRGDLSTITSKTTNKSVSYGTAVIDHI